jgi:hypothetical protein
VPGPGAFEASATRQRRKTASSHSGQTRYSAVALNAASDARQSINARQCGQAQRARGAGRQLESIATAFGVTV